MRQAIGGAKREPSRSIFSPFCSRNSSDSVPQRGDDGMTELNWKRLFTCVTWHCVRSVGQYAQLTRCSVRRWVCGLTVVESRVGPNSKHWFTASFLQPLYHCIMYRGTGIEFSWVPSHCCLYWNEMSNNLAIQVAVKKKCLSHHPVTYYYRLMRLFQYLRRMCVNKLYLKK